MTTKDFHPVSIPKSSRSSDLVWSDRSMSLADLMKEMTLPVIVKMNAEDKSKKVKDASAMLQQPLLLYKEVKGYKCVARNVSSLVAVKTSKDGVEYKDSGSVIVLPVHYRGNLFLHVVTLLKRLSVFISDKIRHSFCRISLF